MEIAVLALGCFWGPEIKFSKLIGVNNTEVGYCGGNNKITTYEEVCLGNTNHAEVVKLDFNSNLISYEIILDYFWKITSILQPKESCWQAEFGLRKCSVG